MNRYRYKNKLRECVTTKEKDRSILLKTVGGVIFLSGLGYFGYRTWRNFRKKNDEYIVDSPSSGNRSTEETPTRNLTQREDTHKNGKLVGKIPLRDLESDVFKKKFGGKLVVIYEGNEYSKDDFPKLCGLIVSKKLEEDYSCEELMLRDILSEILKYTPFLWMTKAPQSVTILRDRILNGNYGERLRYKIKKKFK